MSRTHAIASVRSKLVTSVFILVMMVSACLTTSQSFAQSEPPLAFGRGNAEGLARSTELQDISQGTVTYKIEYYNPDLTSYALIDLGSRVMIKEVFPRKWVVSYEYDSTLDRISQVPSTINIYKDAGDGRAGRLINVYRKNEPIGNGMFRYYDQDGHEKIIDCVYFEIISGY